MASSPAKNEEKTVVPTREGGGMTVEISSAFQRRVRGNWTKAYWFPTLGRQNLFGHTGNEIIESGYGYVSMMFP